MTWQDVRGVPSPGRRPFCLPHKKDATERIKLELSVGSFYSDSSLEALGY